jgi:hypothetical protein
MSNKYDAINLTTLLLHIQTETEKLIQPDIKKKMSVTLMKRRLSEIREMRMSVTDRLRKMDRTKPEFFPKGAAVIYHNTTVPVPPADALVVDHEDRLALIQLLKENIIIKGEPSYLTLKPL